MSLADELKDELWNANAEISNLRAKLRDRERRIREARRDLERRGVLRLSVSEELLDLRRGRK